MTLAGYLLDGSDEPLADALAGWLAASPRFRAFADAHRDKIRKKLRTAADADARLDVRAELCVAHLLLADRRIDVAFEPAGAARGGPDFAVSFRTHAAFNLEVTRPRAALEVDTIGRAVLAKLRQLPPSAANVLLLAVEGEPPDERVLADAMRELVARASVDPALLARGRLDGPRAFHQRFARLGGLVAWSEEAVTAWRNPSARIAVPDGAWRACIAALIGGARPR